MVELIAIHGNVNQVVLIQEKKIMGKFRKSVFAGSQNERLPET